MPQAVAPAPGGVAAMPGGPTLTGPMLAAPGVVGTVVPGPVVSSPMMPGPVFSDSYMGGGSPGCGGCGGHSPFSCGSCCDGGCCTDGGSCCEDGCCYQGDSRWDLRAEALLWWIKGMQTPPLVTQGSAADAHPVALGQPGTSVLFPNGDLATVGSPGGRFTAGYWFCDDHLIGIEGSFFFLGQNNGNGPTTFSSNGSGSPFLARPFLNVSTGAPFEDAQPVSIPGLVKGSVSVTQSSELWGTELNLKTNLCCGPNYFIDLIGGFRQLKLDESLNINESLTSLPFMAGGVPVPGGQMITQGDGFTTRNTYFGGQLGANAEWRFLPCWTLGMNVKLGMGATNQMADITGFTTQPNAAGVATTTPGGLLTRAAGTSPNIGNFSRDQFSFVPEVGLNIGYQVTDHIRLFAGYNMLYWSNVARPGNQIDRSVDPFQTNGVNSAAGAQRPTFMFQNSDFWAQGVVVGLQFRW